MLLCDARDRRFAREHVVARTRDLDEEHRAGVEREPGVIVGFDRRRDELVHDLECGRHDPGGNDRRYRLRGRLDVGKRREADANRLGERQQTDLDGGHETQRPLGADQ